MKQPDPKKHQIISFAKSILRIIAAGLLISGWIAMAGIYLLIAEILGIAEELV